MYTDNSQQLPGAIFLLFYCFQDWPYRAIQDT